MLTEPGAAGSSAYDYCEKDSGLNPLLEHMKDEP